MNPHVSATVLAVVLLFVAVACAEDGAPTDTPAAQATAVLTSTPRPAPVSSDSITPAEAKNHVGSRKTVCGHVASATYARSSRGQPTFLNLDRPYPNQIFTALIWGQYRDAFPSAPESLYQARDICVSGLLELYQGVLEIEVSSSAQIAFD